MINWEFRLQKKGDRTWLLLESPTTEISEGEYRLAVRSQFRGAIVTIQMEYTTDGGEQPLSEEHYEYTNNEGLMMMMPFRELKAGKWNFKCEIAGLNFAPQLELTVLAPPPEASLLQLMRSDFLVDDQWHIQLPIAIEGTGELAITLKNPHTLDMVVDIRRHLWQGGKLDLTIELPQKPITPVLIGTVSFGGQEQNFTVTYPPHLLPPRLFLQELPPLTPKLNHQSSTPTFVCDRPDPFVEKLEAIGSSHSTMDDELAQLLPPPTPRPPAPHPRLPQQYSTVQHRHPPLPTLDIPDGELIAGIPIPVVAYLPATASPQTIKLWLKDCQTRSILDGPRWLVDFHNQDGTLQSLTQITVPLGCLEVEFEAIAIDMENQRESYKTRTIRKITPPNFA